MFDTIISLQADDEESAGWREWRQPSRSLLAVSRAGVPQRLKVDESQFYLRL